MSENKKEIPGISPSNIKKDLMQFKDDILKDLRSVQSSLDNKYLKADEFIKQKITTFELKLNSFSEKIGQLSNLIITDTSIREKVDSLNEFKIEMKDTIFKRRAKFNELETQINNDINRINNILSTTVLYPSLISKSGKFKSFHEYMDYTVQEIAQLILFKEKSGLDLTPFKRKLDTTIDALKLQLNAYSSKEYVDNLNKKTEENMRNLFKIFDDRLQDTRVENSHYAFGMKKKSEEMENLVECLKKMQNNLNKKLENQQNDENNYGNEINHIKNKIYKMNEIIKELLSYHPQSKKNHMHELEKQSSKIYSGVKQYIKGNLNASELSSMKKFTYQKSKTKMYDNSVPSTSPFPSPDVIKNNNDNPKYYSNNKESRDDNTIPDHTKIFMNKNSFFDNDKGEKNDNIVDKKKMLLRRKTLNYDKINSFNSFETNKANRDIIRHYSNKKINDSKSYNNIIEENNININKFKNTNDNNNFGKINNINEESNKNNQNINNKEPEENNLKEKNNAFVIKEEDENALSDNSCKNLEIISSKNKHAKHNNPKEKKENKTINKEEEDRKQNSSIIIDKEEEYKNKDIKNNKNTEIIKEKQVQNINNKKNTKKNINNGNYSEDESIMKQEKRNIIPKSDNNKIRMVSFKQTPQSSTLDNNKHNTNSSTHFLDNKNTLNKINMEILNLLKNHNQNQNNITPRLNSNKKSSDYNLIINQNQQNNYILNKKNIYKSPQSSNNYMSLDNKKNYPRNNDNNLIPNNVLPVNKINRTYTSFPKINHDISGIKIYNNYFDPKDMSIFEKTSNMGKFTIQTAKVAAYINKPKKVLLTSPDNIPPNAKIRRRNNIKNINSEKSNKIRKNDNLYNSCNNNLVIKPYQLRSNDEEMVKSFKNIKGSKKI